jgi:hypothetical protein
LQALLGHTTLDMVKRYFVIAQTDIDSDHEKESPFKVWKLYIVLRQNSRKSVPERTVRVREVGGSNPLTPTQFFTALPEGGASFKASKRVF